MVIQARKLGWKRLIVPLSCTDEASLVTDVDIIACDTVTQVVAYLEGRLYIRSHQREQDPKQHLQSSKDGDYSDVVRHEVISPYLIIAMNLLLVRIPGRGK